MRFIQNMLDVCVGGRAAFHANWGETHFLHGDMPAAVERYTQALLLEPDNIPLRLQRARVYLHLGDYEHALADDQHCLTLDSHCALAHLHIGLIAFEQGDHETALGHVNLAIYYDPRQPLAYNQRGLINEALGNALGAIADYTQAIRLSPSSAVIDIAYTNRGGARAKHGDLRGALADYRRYLAMGGGQRHGDQREIERLIDALEQRH
ncbi:MAG: tetratricopeptide repeat protein [bacterium]|nr:tetratricopeptide repeat protein [bacterium]